MVKPSMVKQLYAHARFVLPLVLSGLIGCSSNEAERERDAAARDEENSQAVLHTAALASFYQRYEQAQKRPPSGWSDMVSFAKDPNFLSSLQLSSLKVTWDASINDYIAADDDLSMFVLVYDPDAGQDGGWVGMADGSVRKVTAEEFQRLPLLGQAAPGSIPEANLQARLTATVDELKSNDRARVNTALADLEKFRKRKAPRQEVADALLGLLESDLEIDDQRVVEELGNWAMLNHLPKLRELKDTNKYDSKSFRKGLARLEEKEEDEKWDEDRAATRNEVLNMARDRMRQDRDDDDDDDDKGFGSSGFPRGKTGPSIAKPEEKKLSPEEERAQIIAKLRSGDHRQIDDALERLSGPTQMEPDEEITGILLQLLPNPPTFVQFDDVLAALTSSGTSSCLAPMRELLRSGQIRSIFDKRDLAAAIPAIEKRLGLALQPGDPMPSSARLKVGDKVFVQVKGVWTAGEVLRVLPRGFYRIAAGEIGAHVEDNATVNQLRYAIEPKATASDPASRVWIDASGDFKVEAEFVDFRDGKVRLKKKADGLIVTLPIEQLSPEDQKIARELSE